MPINKRESLLFTFIMCFCMVLWMSIYNVALQHGAINGEVVAAAWLGFPVAYGSVEKVGVRALAAPVSDIRNQLIS